MTGNLVKIYLSDSLRVKRQTSKEFSLNLSRQTRDVTETRNEKWRTENEKRRTGNGERGTGNGERGTENEEGRREKGERRTVNGCAAVIHIRIKNGGWRDGEKGLSTSFQHALFKLGRRSKRHGQQVKTLWKGF